MWCLLYSYSENRNDVIFFSSSIVISFHPIIIIIIILLNVMECIYRACISMMLHKKSHFHWYFCCMLNVYVGMHIDVTWKFSSLVLFSFRFARTASATVKLEALRPHSDGCKVFFLWRIDGWQIWRMRTIGIPTVPESSVVHIESSVLL